MKIKILMAFMSTMEENMEPEPWSRDKEIQDKFISFLFIPLEIHGKIFLE